MHQGLAGLGLGEAGIMGLCRFPCADDDFRLANTARSGSTTAASISPAGTRPTGYTHDANNRLTSASDTITAMHCCATNRLGSVIGMANGSGTLTDPYLYSPFGVEELLPEYPLTDYPNFQDHFIDLVE